MTIIRKVLGFINSKLPLIISGPIKLTELCGFQGLLSNILKQVNQ